MIHPVHEPAARDTWERVACDLCGADDPEPLLRLRDRMFQTTDEEFPLVRCRRCGLRYLNPRPAPAALDRYYPATYAPFARRGLAARAKAWHVRRQVRDLGPLLAPPRRVLDVGCATGDLLQAVREAGNPNVLGVEPSPMAAEAARQRGLDVRTGTLEEVGLPGASVDTVLMAHVIEHLPSPSRTLAEVARVLRPGGVLVLWLPNADSLAARLLGPWWMGYDAPRHLCTFTVATLAQLLATRGFAVHAVHHEAIGIEWSWGLRLYARDRWPSPALDRLLGHLHPALAAAATPLALAAALAHKSGRIRVVARRAAVQAGAAAP